MRLTTRYRYRRYEIRYRHLLTLVRVCPAYKIRTTSSAFSIPFRERKSDGGSPAFAGMIKARILPSITRGGELA
jgi:hypothetical protein